MANGTRQGAHGTTRRNGLPRVHSLEGVLVRARQRAITMPKAPGTKYVNGFRKPGSMNPRKVGRG